MPCPPCRRSVPGVSERVVKDVLDRIPAHQRTALLVPTLEWLCAQNDGIENYRGIVSRQYTNDEKREIAYDQSVVAELPCPYITQRDDGTGCMLGGLGPLYNPVSEMAEAPHSYGWLPTLIARALDHDTLHTLATSHAIADAKIAMMTRTDVFPVRPQVETVK